VVAFAPDPTAAGAPGNRTLGPGPMDGTTDSRVVVAFGGGAFGAGVVGVVVVEGVVLVAPVVGGVVVIEEDAPVEPEQPASMTPMMTAATGARRSRLVELGDLRAFGKRSAPRRPNLTA
jgi:hypothetical protein